MSRRFTLLPRSLAARTALVLLAGLVVVQMVGLAIHALDRLDFARLTVERETGGEVASIYRLIADTDPPARDAMLARAHLPSGFRASLGLNPEFGRLSPAPDPIQRMLRRRLDSMPMGAWLRPSRIIIASNIPREIQERHFDAPLGPEEPDQMWRGDSATSMAPDPFHLQALAQQNGGGLPDPLGREIGRPPPGLRRSYAIAMQLPDDQRWLSVRFVMPLPDPFLSPTLPIAFLVMTIFAGLLSVWAVRRLTAPLRTLAIAAEKLGRDVNADPLPENGPTEVATAAIAFNTMASRIRRFITDRTLLLTAIGHDLRTPITRLKLRSEFIEDEELQAKFLADLDELEAMVSATLAFGRDSANREPMVALDLNALLRTILDDAVDGRPELAERVGFTTQPPAVVIQARPLALKRALANLVGNAIAYAGGVQVTLRPAEAGHVAVLFDDDGPGIPAQDLERVFEPFVRIEASRNRETGGTGLGLSIARNILRGQGGDITLANRAPQGLRACVTLVA